jgi:hypothetical protein
MQDENFHPNHQRRTNPFKSSDRVSFPSFQDAISRSKDYHVRKFASPESVKGSPKWLNLTIGTQALIHPDSFAEDLCSSYSREESKSPGELNWENLTSPDLKKGFRIQFLRLHICYCYISNVFISIYIRTPVEYSTRFATFVIPSC